MTNPPGHLWRDKWTALSGPFSQGQQRLSRSGRNVARVARSNGIPELRIEGASKVEAAAAARFASNAARFNPGEYSSRTRFFSRVLEPLA